MNARDMAHRIRMLALSCKNRHTQTCEFGNEFADRVEEYLQKCFDEKED